MAFVVMNRVKSKQFPNTVCDVVTQRKQFSWYQPKHKWGQQPKALLEIYAWNKAHKLAREILIEKKHRDPTHGALFYHTVDVAPAWALEFEQTVIIGVHVFYRPVLSVVTR